MREQESAREVRKTISHNMRGNTGMKPMHVIMHTVTCSTAVSSYFMSFVTRDNAVKYYSHSAAHDFLIQEQP
jgi:hypothetical protein